MRNRKRRFEEDWERRIWLFDKLIWSIIVWDENMGVGEEGRSEKIIGKITRFLR